MVESIKNMTMPLGERLAKIDKNIASVRLDKNKFFDLIVDAGYVTEDGSADIKKFNRAANRVGIDVSDRSTRNLQKITKFLNEKSGGSYKNVGRFSAKAIAENAASQSRGFLGEYAEQYSAATKEEFWNDAKKLQRKVNKEKISSLDKVKKIARGLKLKWAVPVGVTTTLLSKMGFGAMGHLMTTEMGDAELPKEPMMDIKNLDFSAPSANAQLLEQMSQDAVMKAGGGMMNMNDMIRPLGYREAGEVGIRERIYDMLAPNEKMSDEELRLQNINPSSVLSEERPKAEGRPEGVLQGLFRELIGAKKAEGSDLSSMAATEILKLNEEIKLLRIDEMLNPEKDNSKSIQGKMNLREYYESLGN